MRKSAWILAILLVVLIVLKYGRKFDGFDGYEGFEDGISVVILKAAWCGHCKKAAPEFEKLVSSSPITLQNGSKATVTMLDADSDKEAIAKYTVKGFPTILIGKSGNMAEYPGERTYDGVVEYLNKHQ
jgi:thiol-disulfide isomerase/thioredoxin